MVIVGRRASVAELPLRMHLYGTIAWLLWLALHIVSVPGSRNRLATLVNLFAVVYTTWPRNLNVIIGDTQEPNDDDSLQGQR